LIKTTRQRILEYLAAHPNTTAAELGTALQVTSADVRHHLANLRSEELVVSASGESPAAVRPGRGPTRGRPARRYRLPQQPPDAGLSRLLSALLAETYGALAPLEQEAFLRRLASRLAGPLLNSANLSQRLVSAVQRLNQLGYQARWEARAAGPRLILDQRPFRNLETQHPELAKLEAYLIEELLGVPLSRIEIIHTSALPESGAVYSLEEIK
jgi:predicted ArsR family transcriptional regulator